MKKEKLKNAVAENKATTKAALETILDNLNQGQRKKVMKVAEVKELCERYGITE